MSPGSNKRKILIDADVISHFISGGEAAVIDKIFPGIPIFILDKVHKELQNWPSNSIRSEISLLLSRKTIKLIDFPDDNEEIKLEYFRIKSTYFAGDGESACLAYVKYTNDVLASSNLKDIRHYCTANNIDYITTMDFLCEAHRTGLFDLTRCNTFITKVLSAGSKLPVTTMEDYKYCREIKLK